MMVEALFIVKDTIKIKFIVKNELQPIVTEILK
jgi:hypothetical protein